MGNMFVFTFTDLVSLILIGAFILFIVGYFILGYLWILITTAWDMIKSDWTGK